MGKRKEEKYAKFRSALEDNRDELTTELQLLVEKRFGPGSSLTGLSFAMVHRRVAVSHLQIVSAGGDEIAWSIIAKVARNTEGEFQRMLALWKSGYNAAQPFGVRMCEPLAFSAPSRTLFMERVEGHTSRNVMRESGSIEPARNAARALLQLHALPVQVEGRSKVRGLETTSIFVSLTEALPDLAPELKRLVTMAQALEATQPLVAVHGDFHIAQVMTGDEDGHVWLLDFGSMFMSDPVFDIGEYLAHVEPEENFHDVQGARALFLSEYLSNADPAMASRVPAYEALAWIRRAMHNLQDASEGPAVVRAMAERAILAAASPV